MSDKTFKYEPNQMELFENGKSLFELDLRIDHNINEGLVFSWFSKRKFEDELETANKLRERGSFFKEHYRAVLQKYGIFEICGDYVLAYTGPEVKEHLDAHGHPTDVFEYNATTETLARDKWGDNAYMVKVYLACIKAILLDGQVLVCSMKVPV